MNTNNNAVDKIGYNNKSSIINEHEVDIDLMGANREQLFRNDHLKSYLIPEIELRYLIKDYLFGNQFIQRNSAYSKQGTNNNGPIQNDTIFNYINEEDYNIMNNGNLNNNSNKSTNNTGPIINSKNSIKNQELLSAINSSLTKIANESKKEKNLINNKRNREQSFNNSPTKKSSDNNLNTSFNTDVSSSNDPQEPMIFNDNYSESDGSNDLMLDELPDNKTSMSKMTSALLEEFKKSFEDKPNNEIIKLNTTYEISKEKLNKWKFQKKIRNYSKDLIDSIHRDGDDIIKIINKIIDQNYYAPDKKMTYTFIEKVLNICRDYGVNLMVQTKLKNLMKRYS